MKKTILSISVVALLFATILYLNQPASPIIQQSDYEPYLNSEHLLKAEKKLSEQIAFWEIKMEQSPGNYVYQKKLASLHASRFRLAGSIQELTFSDSLLLSINRRIPGQTGVLQALATNAITRHAFRDAEKYITEAYETGERKFVSSLILTDVLLERGKLHSAHTLLQDIAATTHFDYLIREMKFQDERGNLASAIENMEKALAIARQSGNESIINWSLSNLADMYGHDGRIEKSYQTYLEALAVEPADLHSLKGIAWIAFSHDKQTAEAERILHFLKSIHPVPDYDLMLAEIARYKHEDSIADAYEESFISQASRPEYGNMYKSYLCEIKSGTREALSIAEAEVAERPHPMSYDLLAWTRSQNGDHEKAVAIVKNHVIYQTEEPVALFHSGVILKKAGRNKEAKKYLEEALEANFELGPVVTQEIEAQLAAL